MGGRDSRDKPPLAHLHGGLTAHSSMDVAKQLGGMDGCFTSVLNSHCCCV